MSANRIALAPIKDSCLNTGLGSNSNTPLSKRKRSSTVDDRLSGLVGPIALIPPIHKKRNISLYSQSFSLTSLPGKRGAGAKSFSFSDYRSTSKRLNNALNEKTTFVKNDTAGLAATKLKLKLQLALYKLQQSRPVSHANLSITIATSATSMKEPLDSRSLANERIATGNVSFAAERMFSGSNSISFKRSIPVNNQASRPQSTSAHIQRNPKLNRSPNIQNQKSAKLQNSKKLNNSTSPNYKSSININLGDKGLLSKIAYDKQSSNLRLFQIKKKSIFYSARGVIPLTSQKSGSSFPKLESFYNMALESNVMDSNTSSDPKPSLPSINKILKTPIKSATRNPFNSTQDDTIDEDGDMTIANTTQQTANQSVSRDPAKLNKRKDSILSSSPIANNFGTPNSFSVAKSLLQLGGYNM